MAVSAAAVQKRLDFIQIAIDEHKQLGRPTDELEKSYAYYEDILRKLQESEKPGS